MVNKGKSNNEREGIKVFRVIATLMVVMVHFGQSLPLPDVIQKPIQFGMYGVAMFFVLSGYLIFSSLDRNSNTIQFYKKRIIRVVPLYYLIITVNILFFSILTHSMTEDSFHLGWARYFLFINTLLPTESVDSWNNISALWTMCAFGIFYLIAPLLYKIMKNIKSTIIFLILMILLSLFINNQLMSMSQVLTNYQESLAYLSGKSAIVVLYQFGFGILAYRIKNIEGYKQVLSVVMFLLFSLIYDLTGITLTCVFTLLLICITNVSFNISFIGSKIVNFIDDYSFSIYLGHTTIISIMRYIKDVFGLNIILFGILSVIGTILFVYLIHNYFEKPVVRFLTKSWIKKDHNLKIRKVM